MIGLGNFGKTLAEELGDRGDEVIGVDSLESRVDTVKDRISLAYILDATDVGALGALPFEDIDCAIVTIGHSMDSSLRVVAALKELKAKKIYARALDAVHKSILGAMHIDKIFVPESYAARMFAQDFMEDGSRDMV